MSRTLKNVLLTRGSATPLILEEGSSVGGSLVREIGKNYVVIEDEKRGKSWKLKQGKK